MSFMRGVVESTIRNMSPEERQDALRGVTEQVVSTMSEQERIDTLTEILGQLVRSIPSDRLDGVLSDTLKK